MTLIRNGDWNTGNRSQYGGVEYVGTFSGSPSVDTRLTVAQTIDGYTARDGGYMAKFLIKPGDQYGSSSGERCLIRWQENNGNPVTMPSGYDSYLAFSILFPTQWGFGIGGNLDIYQCLEWHGPAGVPAAMGFRPLFDHIRIEIKGGNNVFQPAIIVVTDLRNHLGVWHDFIYRGLHHESNGTVQIWHRIPSVEASFRQIVNRTGVPTRFSSGGSYLLWGIYGAAASADRWVYLDANREYSTYAEAEAWMLSLGGSGGGPGPDPDPPPGDPGPAHDGGWSAAVQINATGGAPNPPAPSTRISRGWPHESPTGRSPIRRP